MLTRSSRASTSAGGGRLSAASPRASSGPGMNDEHRIARLLLGLSPGDGVLDVACGTGNFTRDFARSVGPDGPGRRDRRSRTMLAGPCATPAGCAGRLRPRRRDGPAVRRQVLRRRLLLRGPAPVRGPDGGPRLDGPRADTAAASRSSRRAAAGRHRCVLRVGDAGPAACACSSATRSSTPWRSAASRGYASACRLHPIRGWPLGRVAIPAGRGYGRLIPLTRYLLGWLVVVAVIPVQAAAAGPHVREQVRRTVPVRAVQRPMTSRPIGTATSTSPMARTTGSRCSPPVGNWSASSARSARTLADELREQGGAVD